METISTKEVKARKQHKCNWCGCKINIGTIYTTSFCVHDVDTYTWKNHIHCEEIASKLKMFDYADYGVDEENFQETIREEFIKLMKHHQSEVFNYQFYEYPIFPDQLKYVCEMHKIEHP